MKETLGTITAIETVRDLTLERFADLEGRGGRLGFNQILNARAGYARMEGYKVVTDAHTVWVLIDSEQSCCESFGYLSSEDDLAHYVGETLVEIHLTDMALNSRIVEGSGYEPNIQFVSFGTNRGTFQLAVYNSHNGYYGHPVLIAKDGEIVLRDIL